MTVKSTKNITYLFGAGASAGNGQLLSSRDEHTNELPSGIPIVKNFNEDIRIFIDRIRAVADNKTQKNVELFESVFEDLKHLYSFDTYAKSLYESEEHDKRIKYGKLKVLLKCYMVYRQLSVPRDRRYDLFFATLINEGQIPSSVNFLSWNYDTQVENSLSMFTKEEDGNNNRFVKFLDTNLLIDVEQGSRKGVPFLIKLNGSIGLANNLKTYEFVNNSKPNPNKAALQSVSRICDEYFENESTPPIFFSWERKSNKSQQLQLARAKEILGKTDILVIIGYSFPTLNRITDAELLEAMKEDAQIYVQCGSPEHFDEIEVKISALSNKYKTQLDKNGSESIRKIRYVKSNNEFYVPFEFNGLDSDSEQYYFA